MVKPDSKRSLKIRPVKLPLSQWELKRFGVIISTQIFASHGCHELSTARSTGFIFTILCVRGQVQNSLEHQHDSHRNVLDCFRGILDFVISCDFCFNYLFNDLYNLFNVVIIF